MPSALREEQRQAAARGHIRAYYNEHDPHAAEWLVQLMSAGLIPLGDIDRRSIVDVTPGDVAGYTQCHFFAGIGIWPFALRRAGWSDARLVWTASCPCQPFSQVGAGRGFDDERHLWPALYRLVRECRPGVILGEQVSSKDGLSWLDAVFADMEDSDYACAALDLCAAGVGSPQIRQRLYWVADAEGGQQRRSWERLPGEAGPARGRRSDRPWSDLEWIDCSDGRRRPTGPGVRPLAPRSAGHLERLRGYGNGLCAEVAVEFIAAYLALDRGSDAHADWAVGEAVHTEGVAA